MSSLLAARCPGCGIVLAEPGPQADVELELALDPQAPPRARIRQQSKLAQSLRQVVARYTSHNDELEKALRKSPVGGRLFAAHRFKDQ